MGWLADDQSGVIGGVWVAENGQYFCLLNVQALYPDG
jgi:hypothetical protein